MTRINESCSATPDLGAQFEEGVSEAPEPPKAVEPDASEGSQCQQSTDSFTQYTQPQSISQEPGGPRRATSPTPEPPDPPRGKRDPSLPQAVQISQLEREWTEYNAAYKSYVGEFRQAMKDCTSFEELRAMQPEPPDDTTMDAVGFPTAAQALRDQYVGLFKAKVERGHALKGETLPGSFSAGADLEFLVPRGLSEFGVKGSAGVDTLGVHVRGKGVGKVGKGVVIGAATDGKLSGSVDLGVAGLKATTDGTVTLKVAPTGGPLKGSVAYNPSAATVAVGVSVGHTFETPLGPVKAEVSGHGALKGVSQEDARRALDGWMRPTSEDVTARLLRQQQLRAQLKP